VEQLDPGDLVDHLYAAVLLLLLLLSLGGILILWDFQGRRNWTILAAFAAGTGLQALQSIAVQSQSFLWLLEQFLDGIGIPLATVAKR